MIPADYKKLIVTEKGADFRSVSQIVLEKIPELTEQQILIKNQYAGVNAGFDTLLSQGKLPYFNFEYPFDLGVEAVGKVVAVGPAVKELKIGDAVATTGRGGGYREYQIVDAAVAVKIPEAVPEVLTLMPTGVSALVALEQVGEMSSNEVVLVTAAAGGTGHIAVQLAKLAGNHVIGTCGSTEKAELLQKLDCDRVINYRSENVDRVLSEEYPQGINLIFECVGKQMFDIAVKHLAVRGRLVVVGFFSEYAQEWETVNQPRIYHQLFWKGASVRGFLMPLYQEYIPQARNRLLQLWQTGQLKVAIDPTYFRGIESITAAVEYQLSGQNCGKVVVKV